MTVKPADTDIGAQMRELHALTGWRLAIDEDCPGCGWGERWFDGEKFGCNKCDHRGDFRDN